MADGKLLPHDKKECDADTLTASACALQRRTIHRSHPLRRQRLRMPVKRGKMGSSVRTASRLASSAAISLTSATLRLSSTSRSSFRRVS